MLQSKGSSSCCSSSCVSRMVGDQARKPHFTHRVYFGIVCDPLTLGIHPSAFQARSAFAAAAAAVSSSDSGMEPILESLREAFHVAPTPQQNQLELPSVPSLNGTTTAGSESSSHSRAGSRRVQQMPLSAENTDTVATDIGIQPSTIDPPGEMDPSKKRRGRFGDLIQSLQHAQLHPAKAPPAKASNGNRSSRSIITTTTTTNSSNSGNSSNNDSGPSILQSRAPQSITRGRTSSSNRALSSSSKTNLADTPGSSSIRRLRKSTGTTGSLQPQQQRDISAPAALQHTNFTAAHPNQQQQQQSIWSSHDQQQQQQPPWLQQMQAEAAAAAAASGSRRVKQYKPVAKGDLLLPGGPAWSSLRRHVMAAGSDPTLPFLDVLVVVEGDKDHLAVSRAVNAPVYVCDGTRALKEHVQPELRMLQQLGRTLVVLTDPDERGRELRGHLDDLMPGVHHAFVPEQDGTSSEDGPVHAAGNRGIEHVVPTGVQRALAAAKPSWPKNRAVWSPEELQRLQLANAFDAGHRGVVRGPAGAAARRRRLCALLGLGKCNAAQLLAALNRFFAEEHVEAALQQVNAELGCPEEDSSLSS